MQYLLERPCYLFSNNYLYYRMDVNKEYSDLGNSIIGAAFEVMKTAGKGLKEKYYESALAYELEQRGHRVERQVSLPALYKGVKVDDAYQADIVIDNKVIIEVKAISLMTEKECRQLVTYLKLSGYKLGYLINFGAKGFHIGNTKEPQPYKNGIYRFVNNL